jgi:uncharacterized protein (TIGR02246 family)
MSDISACIIEKTTAWQQAVEAGQPAQVAAQFCDDAVLVGTVSQTLRTDSRIKDYFNYFAKLPNIKVQHRTDSVVSVTEDVAINNALVDWSWEGQDSVEARMTFVYRREQEATDWCLFELHSSVLPEANLDLRRQ